MKKNLSFLFVLAFILLGATYAISLPLYINNQLYGEYSAISVGPSGRVDISTVASPPPSGNTITGQVTSTYIVGKTIGIAGVTMTLGGTSSGTSVTNTNGNYTFTGLADGSYTVTPSHGSYTFSPASGSANPASNQTATVNFGASPVQGKTYSIFGNVKDKNGANLPGVTMQLQWGSTVLESIDLTGADGNYVIPDLPDGLTYIVTPIMTGKSFTPTSQNVLVNGSDVTGKNFVEQSGPSGSLGSITNPYKLNKTTAQVYNGYIPENSPNDSRGDILIPAGSKVYFVVDPVGTTGTSAAFKLSIKFYSGAGAVCKLTQTNGAYSAEACQGSDSFMDIVLYPANTKFLYAIDNSLSTGTANDQMWVTMPFNP